MVSRLISLLPVMAVTLAMLSATEKPGLAGEHLRSAAYGSGQRSAAGRAAAEPGNGIPTDEKAAASSAITADNLSGPLPGPPPASQQLVLMGIVDGGSRDSRAIILSKKDKQQQLYQVGDLVAGARVKSILWGKVVLSVSGRDEVLDMKETARYRAVETAAVPLAVPAAAPEQTVAASAGAEEDAGQLIPERVRLTLPDQEGDGSPPPGE